MRKRTQRNKVGQQVLRPCIRDYTRYQYLTGIRQSLSSAGRPEIKFITTVVSFTKRQVEGAMGKDNKGGREGLIRYRIFKL